MENKVISEYKIDLTIEGKELKAVLKSYEEPIRKSEVAECYTRLEIFDGDDLWGSMNYSNPVGNEEEAAAIFSTIEPNSKLFKA